MASLLTPIASLPWPHSHGLTPMASLSLAPSRSRSPSRPHSHGVSELYMGPPTIRYPSYSVQCNTRPHLHSHLPSLSLSLSLSLSSLSLPAVPRHRGARGELLVRPQQRHRQRVPPRDHEQRGVPQLYRSRNRSVHRVRCVRGSTAMRLVKGQGPGDGLIKPSPGPPPK